MTLFSSETEPGVESELVDLGDVAFASLRELDGEVLRQSMGHVVDRTRRLRPGYRSNGSGGGERID
jgi:hypothetical protein